MSEILVVDLDGTLLRSDMLYETFWDAFATNWFTPLMAMRELFDGKAALKLYLAEHSNVDVTRLPYDEEVINFIIQHRDNGGRVALVTATNQTLAIRIAEHLEIFDEVYGSGSGQNLKGQMKAQFLLERYGQRNFIYMGDAAADLPVWTLASKIVTVNASNSVRKQATALGGQVQHLQTRASSYLPYIKTLRPHQWIKNALVFLPMLVSHELNIFHFLQSIYAFIAFCCVASSVYILNDLLDLRSDRAHPRKRLRPFAAGDVSLSFGIWALALLLCAGAIIAQLSSIMFSIALCVYFTITLAYSLFLKRKVVVDICVLAGLYTMRIISGGTATGIELSVWLLAFSIFFFLSLASVKRQAELVDLSNRNELVIQGRGYAVTDLPIISSISITAGYLSVLVMALYINSPVILELYQTPEALWGICCVLIYWITRVVLVAQRGLMHDDPVVFASTDRSSQTCVIVILILIFFGASW